MSIVFLDIEASSLDLGSFPMKIAWVDEEGVGKSYLISPRFNWSNWSAASEKLHGISRAMLDSDGTPAFAVAQLAHEALRGRTICLDNAAFDAYWLSMLLELIGQPSLEVDDFDKLRFNELGRLCSITKAATPDGCRREPNGFMKQGQRYVALVDAQEVKRLRTQHRALPDADSLWRRWSAIRNGMSSNRNHLWTCKLYEADRFATVLSLFVTRGHSGANSSTGRLMLSVIAAVGRAEREGRYKGRAPIARRQIIRLKEGGVSPLEIAFQTGDRAGVGVSGAG